MLGSMHDGEIAAAGRQAERIRREAGLSWGELLSGNGDAEIRLLQAERDALRQKLARVRAGQSDDWIEPDSVDEAIERCLDFEEYLTDWERDFLPSLAGWRGRLTPKQAKRLAE